MLLAHLYLFFHRGGGRAGLEAELPHADGHTGGETTWQDRRVVASRAALNDRNEMASTSIMIQPADKSKPPVKVKWYGSPSTAELCELVCEMVGLHPGTQFQLVDANGEPVAITPDLSDGTALQLVVGEVQASATENSEVEQRGLLDEPKLLQNLKKFKAFKEDETLLFADICAKINIKMKHQDRVLVVTTEAVYNVDPSGFKVKRRIDLRSIEEISISCLEGAQNIRVLTRYCNCMCLCWCRADDYLVMHVPSEYDYLWVTNRKRHLVQLIRRQFKVLSGGTDMKMNVSNGIQYRVEKKTCFYMVFTQVDSTTPLKGSVNVKIYHD
eukprot:SAG31_NODE_678_length_12892_cov_5.458063_10_plen_327_part_00